MEDQVNLQECCRTSIGRRPKLFRQMEDDLHFLGKWKTTATLASTTWPELGTAQPQLVFIFLLFCLAPLPCKVLTSICLGMTLKWNPIFLVWTVVEAFPLGGENSWFLIGPLLFPVSSDYWKCLWLEDVYFYFTQVCQFWLKFLFNRWDLNHKGSLQNK